MKKWFLSSVLISCVFFGFSQKLDFSAYVGYGFGMQKHFYSAVSYYYEAELEYEDAWNTEKLYKFSLGSGLRYGIALGNQLSERISLELGYEQFKGKPQQFETLEVYNYIDVGKVNFTNTYEITGKYSIIKPALILMNNLNEFQLRLKFGAYLGICSMIQEMDTRITNSLPGYYPFESYESEFGFKKQFSYGFFISLGCDYKIFEKVKLFTEIIYGSLMYVPTSGEYTKYIYRGDDILEDLNTNERYFEYVDDLDRRENLDTSKPTKVIKDNYSLSHLIINFGIKVVLLK